MNEAMSGVPSPIGPEKKEVPRLPEYTPSPTEYRPTVIQGERIFDRAEIAPKEATFQIIIPARKGTDGMLLEGWPIDITPLMGQDEQLIGYQLKSEYGDPEEPFLYNLNLNSQEDERTFSMGREGDIKLPPFWMLGGRRHAGIKVRRQFGDIYLSVIDGTKDERGNHKASTNGTYYQYVRRTETPETAE